VLAAALALAAVALAAGGWSGARHGTGAEKAGIGTGLSTPAHHTAALAGTAGPLLEGGDVAIRRHGTDHNPVAVVSGMAERCR
jgi:hypothetical protein